MLNAGLTQQILKQNYASLLEPDEEESIATNSFTLEARKFLDQLREYSSVAWEGVSFHDFVIYTLIEVMNQSLDLRYDYDSMKPLSEKILSYDPRISNLAQILEDKRVRIIQNNSTPSLLDCLITSNENDSRTLLVTLVGSFELDGYDVPRIHYVNLPGYQYEPIPEGEEPDFNERLLRALVNGKYNYRVEPGILNRLRKKPTYFLGVNDAEGSLIQNYRCTIDEQPQE